MRRLESDVLFKETEGSEKEMIRRSRIAFRECWACQRAREDK